MVISFYHNSSHQYQLDLLNGTKLINIDTNFVSKRCRPDWESKAFCQFIQLFGTNPFLEIGNKKNKLAQEQKFLSSNKSQDSSFVLVTKL